MSDLITMPRAVLEQALEALVWEAGSEPALYSAQTLSAITALRAALEQPDRAQRMRDAGHTRRPTLREMADPEQPEQEPVLTKVSANGSFLHPAWEEVLIGASLYAHPPRREWRGLTEEDMIDIQDRCGVTILRDEFIAIEAALKEKNT